MPRAGRRSRGSGGARTGTPGTSYANRTDLNQPVRVPTGLPYGERQARVQALKAAPIPQQAPVNAAPPPAGPPPQVTPLSAPTQRPNEPVTAGAPIGPGPGTEAIPGGLSPGVSGDPTLEVLQGLYRIYGNDDLRGMIEQASRTTP